ncbi:TPA: hypothetical protein HA265_01390 [Candidatus Woesearchaeota archaeon]|nr:hypothetical protein [Candidatus Woesearchaeota archaeon]
MAYAGCPMFGTYGVGGFGGAGLFYLNILLAAIIFAGIFWGAYYLFVRKTTYKKELHMVRRK